MINLPLILLAAGAAVLIWAFLEAQHTPIRAQPSAAEVCLLLLLCCCLQVCRPRKLPEAGSLR
jgi:hypothetical protein